MNKTSGKSKIETSKVTLGRSARSPIVSSIQREIVETPKYTISAKTKAVPGTSNVNLSKSSPVVSHIATIPVPSGTSMNTNNSVLFKRKLTAGTVNIVPCVAAKNETYVPILSETAAKTIVGGIAIPIQAKAEASNGCLYVTSPHNISRILPSNITITPVNNINNTIKVVQMSGVAAKVPQQKKYRCTRCKKSTDNPKFCDNCQSEASTPQRLKTVTDSPKIEQTIPVTKTPVIAKDKFYANKPTSSQTVATCISGNSFSTPTTTRKIFVVSDQQGKARGRPKGSKNKVVEPECLTISSSDEGEDDDSPQTLETSSQMKRKNSSIALQRGVVPKIQMKINPQQRRSYRLGRVPIEHPEILEPEDGEVIEDEEEEEEEEIDEEEEEILHANMPSPSRIPLPGECMAEDSTTLQCRSIRIGSFKIHPLNDSPHLLVHVTQDSFSFHVSKVARATDLTFITLRGSDISQVLGHFGRCLPIMFIFTTSTCAARIRKQLGMEKGSPFYYDPDVDDDKQKRITLLIDNMNDDLKTFLRGQFPGEGILLEIDQKAANEILVRSTPSQTIGLKSPAQPSQPSSAPPYVSATTPVVMAPAQIQVQSSPQLTVQPIQSVVQLPSQGTVTVSVSLQAINSKDNSTTSEITPKTAERPMSPVRKIVTYPPPPETDSIELNTGDLVCLNEEEFLNDKIIDFYLRYLVLEKLEEKDRERTHVFNSYFYRGLTQKPNKRSSEDRQKSIAELRHRQVKKWTKNLNIFEKDFIIIPINQNAHWFLAIICYPKLASEVKRVSKQLSTLSDNSTSHHQNTEGPTSTSQLLINTISPIKVTKTKEQISDNNECSSTESSPSTEFHSSNEDTDTICTRKSDLPDSTRPAPGQKAPFIILFDSLPGPSRTQIGKTLKEYLEWEWKLKKGNSSTFDTTAILHGTASVPQQHNFSDCGIYVLQYVESFFEHPFPYIAYPLPDMKQWFTAEQVATKREEIRTLIYELEKRLTPNSSSSVDNAHSAKNEDNITNTSRNS